MSRTEQPGGFELAQTAGGHACRGALTFATATQALKQTAGLFKDGGTTLCFDLAGIERADSAGMALLVEWLRLAQEADIRLRYARPPEHLQAMARVSGLAECLSPDPATD